MGVILEFQGSDEELADNCFFCFVAVFVESSQDWVASSCHGWTLLSWLILLVLWLFALHICSLKSSMCSFCFRTVALFLSSLWENTFFVWEEWSDVELHFVWMALQLCECICLLAKMNESSNEISICKIL